MSRISHEQPLAGGVSNSGLVVRVGDTVHRPQTSRSPAVHALLQHLERVGFDGAPRYLGEDEHGREVLSYVEGQAATKEPHERWALTDDALRSVARLLRRFHDAVRTFDASGHDWPTDVPAAFREGLVTHNDVNLDNVVFRAGEAVALIDFDLASPGSAVWDVALAARLWVPLRADAEVADERRGHREDRLRLFADAYGLPETDRRRLVAAALETHHWCYAIVRAGAERGVPGYVRYWSEGAQRRAERVQAWLADHASELDRALGPAPSARGRATGPAVSPAPAGPSPARCASPGS
jgi:Ser/Thr protein kinase RdoA (MazF antagonist)